MGHADRAGFLIIGRAVGMALGLAAPVVLTRLLDRDAFGTYRQLILLSNLLSTVVILGLPGTLLYFFPRVQRDLHRALVFQVSLLLVLLGAASAGGLILLRTSVGQLFHNPALVRFLPLFSVYAGAVVATGHVYNLLVVEERVRRAAVYSAFVSSIPTLGALVGALALRGLDGAVVGVCIGAMLIVAWGTLIVCKSLTATRTPEGSAWWERRLFREQLDYGIPLGLAGAVGAVENWVDHLVVSALLFPAAYALYSIGAFAIPVVMLLTNAVTTALVPVWARMLQRNQAAAALDLFRRSVRRLALIAMPATVLSLLVAPDLIRLLFSARYADSVPVFRVFLLMLVAHTFAPSGLLRGTGSTRPVFAGALGGLGVAAGLTALGLHLGGLPGAALGKVTAECLRKAFYGWIIRRHVGRQAGPLLPWSELLRIGAIAALAAVPAATLIWLLPAGPARLAAVLVVYATSYFLTMAATGTLSQSDRELIRRWTAPRFLIGKGRG